MFEDEEELDLPFDLDEAPLQMRLEDWKTSGDQFDEAADTLNGADFDALCEFLKKKLDEIVPF